MTAKPAMLTGRVRDPLRAAQRHADRWAVRGGDGDTIGTGRRLLSTCGGPRPQVDADAVRSE